MNARHQAPSPDNGAGQPPLSNEGGKTRSGRKRFSAGRAKLAHSLFRPRSIRGKLAHLLVVSLTVVVGVLSYTVVIAVGNYQAAAATAKATSLVIAVQDLVHELQRERGLSSGLLGGETRFRSQLTTERSRTDAALAALERMIANDNSAGATTVRAAVDKLRSLPATRNDIDSGKAQRDPTFQYFTDIIAELSRVDPGAGLTQDPNVQRDLQALQSLNDAKEMAGQERGFLNGVFAAGRFDVDQYLRFVQMRAGKLADIADFARYAMPDAASQANGALRSAAAFRALADENTALRAYDGVLPTKVDATAWWSSMTTVIDDLRTVQISLNDDIRADTSATEGAAMMQLIGVSLLALLAIAAEVLIALAAMRSIIGPLAALVSEADDVASQRLPAAVARAQAATDDKPLPAPPSVQAPAQASSEIVAVAGALDRVQKTAWELATEQAVLRRDTTESLANLGRRNQNLLRRQLGFISQLEQEELDPSALANLFELDHLATRMRRNAESLLALVGQLTPRRWSEPVPITDVIRAALSEVEDYRRVAIRRVEDVRVAGAVVAELAHMLAELIENGLSFSPPDIEVEIYGRRMGGQYLVAVIDHGIGMRPDMIAQANSRLRGNEDFLVAPTRFLGHFVVGRLAQRLSVDIQLSDSPLNGITAKMILPADLVTESRAALVAPAGWASQQRPSLEDPTTIATSHVPLSLPAPPVREGTILHPQPPTGPIEPTGWTPVNGREAPPAPARTRPAAAPLAASFGAPTTNSQFRPTEPGNAQPWNGQERTRNGLVKRTPRARTTTPSQPPAPRRNASEESAAPERSPGDVRAMLAAFRAAHRRGESRSVAEPPNSITTGHIRPHREEDYT